MEVHLNMSNGLVEMSFIPVDFYSLESIFGHLSVHCISNLNIGIFPTENPNDDSYYDKDDIFTLLPKPIVNLKPLFSLLGKFNDREKFSVYKLEVDFGNFSILYDDDSFLSIRGACSTKKDFATYNRIFQSIIVKME